MANRLDKFAPNCTQRRGVQEHHALIIQPNSPIAGRK
jgi:hypothetical protein